MPDRPLTDEEARWAREQGITISDKSVIDDQNQIKEYDPVPDAKASDLTTSEPVAPQPKRDFGLGAVARQAGKAILPSLVGKGVGGFIGAGVGTVTSAGSPAAAVTVPAGIIGGNLAGGYAGSRLQDYLLNNLAKNNPGGWADTLQQESAKDIQAHPWLSTAVNMAAGLPIVGGGRPSIPRTIPQAVKSTGMAGLMTGVNAGMQKASNPDQPVDWTTAAIGGVPGVLLGKPLIKPKVTPPVDYMAQAKANYEARNGPGSADKLLAKSAPVLSPEETTTLEKAKQDINRTTQITGVLNAGEKQYKDLLKMAASLPEGSPQKAAMESHLLEQRKQLDTLKGLIPKPGTPEAPGTITAAELKAPTQGLAKPIEQPKPIEGAKPIPVPREAEGAPPKVSSDLSSPEQQAALEAATPFGKPGAALLSGAPEAAAIAAGGQPITSPVVKGPGPRVAIPTRQPEGVTPPDIAALQEANRTPVAEDTGTPAPANQATIEALAQGKPGVTPAPNEPVQPTKPSKPAALTSEALRQKAAEIQAELQKRQTTQRPGMKGGKEEGSVPNPFQGVLGDKLEEGFTKAKEVAGKTAKSVGAVLNAPVKILQNKHLFKPSYDVAETADPELGPLIAKTAAKNETDVTQKVNKYQQIIDNINKQFTPADNKIAMQYLLAKKDGFTEQDLPPLTDKQAKAAAAWKSLNERIGYDRADGPWVQVRRPNGSIFTRPFEFTENHIPEVTSKRVSDIMRNGKGTPEYDSLKEDWIDRAMNYYGVDENQANQLFATRQGPAFKKGSGSPEFAGMRQTEGMGLPDSWREIDPYRVFTSYANRIASDLAFHENFEQNPKLARALNLPDNGKGQPIGEVNKANGTPIQSGELLPNPGVQAILREVDSSTNPDAREFERLMGGFSQLRLGPITRTMHSLRAAGSMWGIMNPGELGMFGQAARKLITDLPGAKAEALRAGSMKTGRNISRSMVLDQFDNFVKLTDAYSKATRAEDISQIGMTFQDSIARLIAAKRIQDGDIQSLSRWLPPNWDEMILQGKMGEQKLIDYISAGIVKNAWSSYSGKDLPNWLGRSSTDPWKIFFSLSRAPIGRFNNWVKDVYEPAKQGNIKPLIMSLMGAAASSAAIEAITSTIRQRKPPELSWSEWLNLGGQDTANMLFTKATTAGYAGFLGELALWANQYSHGEGVMGPSNPLLLADSTLSTRVAQALYSMGKGEASPLAALSAAGTAWVRDNLQAVRLVSPQIERGNREEAIAKRVGYMMPDSEIATEATTTPNPLSLNRMELQGDVEGTRQNLAYKASMGRPPTIPSPEWEGRLTPVLKNGKRVNYYDFIKQAQGTNAANAALERDKANTLKKYSTFRQAVGH